GDLTVSGIDVSGFADGLLTVSVTLTDVAGNTGSTGIDTATKDATPPNAPIITIPASSPVVINVANKSTQTLSGAAEAGSIVEIYVNNLASTVTKVATNGTFIFTNEDLRAFGAGIVSDTDYSSAKVATVKASDAVGNFSVESNAISYTQDATVPSFTMQYYSDEGLTASLADNKRLKQGTYYIKITSSEPLNSTPTIFIDAEGTANDVTDSATVFISGNDYRYARLIAFDTAAVGGILENISITGADVAGNPATSVDPTNEATKAAYTDTVAPTAAISGQPVSPTNSNSVDITVGGTDVTHYQYKLDGGSYGIEIPIATHIILSGLGESQHTLFVIGRDVAGNWQAEPGTATLTWTVDTQAPTATLTNTPNSLTNQTTTDITVGGTDVTHYQYKIDTGLYNSETAVATHIVLSGLSGGAHTISVIGRDVAGNLQLEANAISYSWTIDTAVPSVSSHTPSLNALNISPTTQIVVTFSEAVNVESGDVLFSPTISSGFAITNSGTTVATITPNSSLSNNTTYTITLSGVADLAGNVLPEYGNIKFTTATTYSIALNTNSGGWNLISLPVIPTSTAIDEVLGGAANNIDAVWTYDPTAPNAINGWLVYTGAPNTSNLDMMTAGLGYWISVTGNANLSGSGTLLIAGHTLPPSRSLEAGWNLVGYYQLPGESNSTPAKAFASLQSWSGLWGFNNTTGIFNSVTAINPGDAFWISLTSDKIYTPSN
ncbi:MAG: Ig family protein, partial [Parcubacteria group bacterium GW2011_GWC2_39_11]